MAEEVAETLPIGFKLFETLKSETIETPGGRKLELIFKETAVSEAAKDTDSLKSQAKQLLAEGYDYLQALAGSDFKDLSNRYVYGFINGDFKHAGILMYMDAGLLRDLSRNPKGEKQDLVQSLTIHEIGHNITTGEDIPMFAEMIYMIEKGHVGRITDIKRFLDEGTFAPAYVKGLNKISEWLGYSSASEMLSALPKRDLGELKNVFRQNLAGHHD